MTDYWVEWGHLLLRWFHFTVGIAWIGASFYFNWLNQSVRPPEGDEDGVTGELWAIHGGAYYRVLKYDRSKVGQPKKLHWFKYEAYFTWLSGFSLLILVYYVRGRLFLLRPELELSPAVGAMIGVGCLVGAWVIYDRLCESPLARYPVAFAMTGFALMSAAAYGLTQVFTAKAAYLHVGAMIGTCMAANVFFVIIPGQRAMVDAVEAGRAPDVRQGERGSFRSLHNNYLTLPVLFVMISGHFPMTYGHPRGWAILAALALVSALVRHWFNLKGRGEQSVWILPIAALGLFTLALMTRPAPQGEVAAGSAAGVSSELAQKPRDTRPEPESVAEGGSPAEIARETASQGDQNIVTAGSAASIPSLAEVQGILGKHCTQCHQPKPTFAGLVSAPQGLHLNDLRMVRANLAKIKAQAVDSEVMPLGNLTGMTPKERATLGRWIDAGGPGAE